MIMFFYYDSILVGLKQLLKLMYACRSAVKSTDEWPSKYSKFFVEVRSPNRNMPDSFRFLFQCAIIHATAAYLGGLACRN
jgi:hypothetical protein